MHELEEIDRFQQYGDDIVRKYHYVQVYVVV